MMFMNVLNARVLDLKLVKTVAEKATSWSFVRNAMGQVGLPVTGVKGKA